MVLSVNEDNKRYKDMKKLSNDDLITIIKEKDYAIETLLNRVNELFTELNKINLQGFEELLLDKEVLLYILRRDNLLTDELETEIEYIMKYHNSLKDYELTEEIGDVTYSYEDNIDNIIYSCDDIVEDILNTINNEDVSNEEITMENIDNLNEDELPF